jgi:hypothetical protein
MKTQKILFMAAILLLFQCSLMISNTEKKAIESMPATLADNETANDCFDQKMDKWFQAFNEYQNQGYDMTTADKLSVNEANIMYQNCHETGSKKLAELQTREIE